MNCLANGEWKIGQRLPTERELAARWGVAISTVRAGITQLVTAGVLSRRQGRGTSVAPYDSAHSALRFSNIFDADGHKVSTIRVISRMRKMQGDAEMRKQLRLSGNAKIWHLEGVLRVNGEVAASIDVYLPTQRFATLRMEDITPTQNLYAIYQRCCGVTVLRMQERVYARVADQTLSRRIKVEAGSPLLCTERTAYTFDDEPIEVRRRYFEGNRYHYLFTQDRLE